MVHLCYEGNEWANNLHSIIEKKKRKKKNRQNSVYFKCEDSLREAKFLLRICFENEKNEKKDRQFPVEMLIVILSV